MCPCEICFPNEEPCMRQCANSYVSCPLIEDKIVDTETINANAEVIANSEAKKDADQNESHHILQQPTDLPNLTNLYTQKAIEFMKANTDIDKPFFLYMAYHQTHHPQFAG